LQAATPTAISAVARLKISLLAKIIDFSIQQTAENKIVVGGRTDLMARIGMMRRSIGTSSEC